MKIFPLMELLAVFVEIVNFLIFYIKKWNKNFDELCKILKDYIEESEIKKIFSYLIFSKSKEFIILEIIEECMKVAYQKDIINFLIVLKKDNFRK